VVEAKKIALNQQCHSAAMLQKKHSTQSTRRQNNNNHLNLSLCLLWFLGGFVFEDSFAKKQRFN